MRLEDADIKEGLNTINKVGETSNKDKRKMNKKTGEQKRFKEARRNLSHTYLTKTKEHLFGHERHN